MSMTGPSSVNERSRIVSAAHDSVAKAIDAHGEESIQKAIRSFEWVLSEKRSDVHDFSTIPQQAVIQPAAFSDSPVNYLAQATRNESLLSGFSEFVPMDDVVHILRSSGFHYHQGVNAFLQSGISEALAGLKINEHSAAAQTLVPAPLNELLVPEKLKSADPAALKQSISAVNQMYSTLKNMQDAGTDLKANMLRFVRC